MKRCTMSFDAVCLSLCSEWRVSAFFRSALSRVLIKLRRSGFGIEAAAASRMLQTQIGVAFAMGPNLWSSGMLAKCDVRMLCE